MQIELPNKHYTFLSDEHKEFLIANWAIMDKKDILRLINEERPNIRPISLQRIYKEAHRLGLFQSNGKIYRHSARKTIGKLTLKDKYLVKREYKAGTDIKSILTVVNATKDRKITSDELSSFIEKEVKNTLTRHGGNLNFTIDEDIFIINMAKDMSWYRISLYLNENRPVKMSFNAVKRRYDRLIKLYEQIKPLIPHIENNL